MSEDRRGPGRPVIGPAINIRLSPELLQRADFWAASLAARELVEHRLDVVAAPTEVEAAV